ncbi:antiviral innate immune response receptor RIG-I [Aplysia californica]|uniref:Antiviral innate immune response receptor RIG-I n=1 Tax=Aplysia californica TaxID=6500 RepID=A0ABM0JY82_APLCA|nr:antiviral innate immune response receptor RIG-I [Aplysia californica]
MAEASSEEKKLCNSFQKIKVTEEESDSPALKRLFGEGNKHETSVEILADDDGDVKEHGAEEELDGQENDLCMREYQTELAENAVKGYNTVICAPTGSGKTRVALHIIQEHLQKKEDAKVVFLARTVPLVKQQYSYLQRRLKDKYEVLKVTGGEYGCLEVHGLIKKYDVVVMTPQILLNHLNAVPNSSLKILTLIIFDECHHTQKNEIYNKLMQAYHKTKEETGGEKLPQIVGLTASFGIGNATTNVEGAYMNIVNICGNLDVTKISTVTKHVDEMLKHSPVPVEGNPVFTISSAL